MACLDSQPDFTGLEAADQLGLPEYGQASGTAEQGEDRLRDRRN